MRGIINAIPHRDWHLLAELTAAFALLPLLQLGLGVLQTRWVNGAGQHVARQMRLDLFDHVLHLPVAFFDANQTGELALRIKSDCGRLAGFVSADLVPAAARAVQLVVLTIILLRLDAALALLLFAAFPLFRWLMVAVGRRQAAIERQWQVLRGEGAGMLQEALSGVRTVKAFGREAFENARWADWNARDMGLWLRQTNWSNVLGAVSQSQNALSLAAVLGYGGWQAATGRITLGTVVAFLAYAPQLYGTVAAVLSTRIEIANLESYMARVFAILDTPREPQGAGPKNSQEGAVAGEAGGRRGMARAMRAESALRAPSPGCAISLDDVTLTYADGRAGLVGVTLQIAAGEYVALVGPSGGGKSTLLDLLLRFYPPSGGRIVADGRDLAEWPLPHWRGQTATVSQDVYVWNASIRDNLRYARGGVTEAEMWAAIEAAQLRGFVSGLPAGLNTAIGERGVRLSGGERQRLAMARALLRDPRLLLLDEATAALDTLTERALQGAVRPFLRSRTVVAVAHRLSTILDAERIVVIAGHRVVQEGPHEVLVRGPGVYGEMYRAQFEGLGG